MKKLFNYHHPAGLEWAIRKRMPMALLATIFIPLIMSALVRFYPIVGSAAEIARHQASIDIMAVALLLTGLSAILTVSILCITICIMKGPAYVADAYPLNDAEKPDDDDSQSNGKFGS